jgi:catalase
MTTSSGRPIGDNQNSITAGPEARSSWKTIFSSRRWPSSIREGNPERMVHAKGAGAHGTFTVTGDMTKYTYIKLFGKIGSPAPELASVK